MCDDCTRTAMKLLALAFGNLATTIAQNREHEQDDGILCGHIKQVMFLAQPPIGATEAERTTAGVKVLAAINEYLATLSSEETFVLGSFLDDVEDVTGAISRVVLRDLRRRADAGDAFAESKIQRVPAMDVHVIDLDEIMGRGARPSERH
jgi:hypothetical protein